MEEIGKGRNYERRSLKKKKNFPNRKARRYEHNQLLCGVQRKACFGKYVRNRYRFVVLGQLIGALKS